MNGRVTIGSWVTVKDGEQEEAWGVVDPAEADLGKRLISREAPLARALLGHGTGDVVRVRTPYGTRDVTVLGVEEPTGTR
jgi:transcription elongation GreA/GreB family factor